MFNQSVMTSQGLELDAKIRAGSAAAVFTRIKLGDGIYAGTEILEEVQDLKNVRQVLKISSVSLTGEKTVRIRAVTGNTGVTSGYYITEIGVYAQDPDAGEILYSVATGAEGNLDYQPSEDEFPDSTGLFEYYIAVSNAETATIQLGAGAMAAAEDLLEKVDIDGGNISDTIIGTLEDSTEGFPVPVAGESTKIVFGKIKKSIQDSRDKVKWLENEVAETKKSVSDGKTLLAAAITAKRVAAAATDTFAQLAAKIGQIVLGSGNATPPDVVEGKTFTNASGVEQPGTMPDKSGSTQSATPTLDTANSRLQLTIPATGKYNTASKVYATFAAIASLIGLTAAKLIPGNTILGIASSVASMGAQTLYPGTTAKTLSSSGKYMTGNVTVPAVSIAAAYIKKGQVITFPDGSTVTGTFSGFVAGSGDIYNQGTFGLASGVVSLPYYNGQGSASYWTPGELRLDTGMITIIGQYSLGLRTSNAIDLTGFSTLNITYWSMTTLGNSRTLGVSINAQPAFNVGAEDGNYEKYISASTGTTTTPSTISLDISNISGKRWIAFGTTDSIRINYLYISRIWME